MTPKGRDPLTEQQRRCFCNVVEQEIKKPHKTPEEWSFVTAQIWATYWTTSIYYQRYRDFLPSVMLMCKTCRKGIEVQYPTYNTWHMDPGTQN